MSRWASSLLLFIAKERGQVRCKQSIQPEVGFNLLQPFSPLHASLLINSHFLFVCLFLFDQLRKASSNKFTNVVATVIVSHNPFGYLNFFKVETMSFKEQNNSTIPLNNANENDIDEKQNPISKIRSASVGLNSPPIASSFAEAEKYENNQTTYIMQSNCLHLAEPDSDSTQSRT